jgi:pimeloyl-ACP methyl ester carboxylesterase
VKPDRVQKLAVAIALVVLVGVGAVVASHVGTVHGTPRVVQLPGPTGSASAAAQPGSSLHWTGCGDAQCATLDVPLDWTHTDPAATGKTIPMALIRYPATGTASQRIGSLVVNPGGPGDSGVQFLREDISIIPTAIRQRFDIVSFDPRGTGSSDPVSCLSGPQLDALFALPPYPADATQATQIETATRQLATACAAHTGDELKHLATVDVAKDLDALRAALGEQQLTYLGYSYGTYLGAVYARLFPTHIRAFVLDGAIDPTQTGTQMVAGQAGGFEGAFDAFAAWCAGNTRCAFGASLSTAAQVESAYVSLQAAVAQRPLPGSGSRVVTSGLFLEGTLVTLYDRTDGWPALGTSLALAEQGSGSDLLQLSDEFLERNADGTYDPSDEANAAVNCLDHTYPTVAQTPAFAAALARQYPIFGEAIGWSGLDCAYWPVAPTVDLAPVRAAGAPPILVVATTRDPATPYAGGVALAKQLDTGTLLTYDGDGHTAYRATGSACVIGVVDTYLTTLHAPARSTGAQC